MRGGSLFFISNEQTRTFSRELKTCVSTCVCRCIRVVIESTLLHSDETLIIIRAAFTKRTTGSILYPCTTCTSSASLPPF